MKRRDAIAFSAMVLLLLGLLMPALAQNQDNANQRKSVNNLKMLGLACHNYHDNLGRLANNGGCNAESELVGINYGWHNSAKAGSGSWITMIAPYLEEVQFFNATDFKNVSSTAVPETWPDDKAWKVELKPVLCPGRGRTGFKTGKEKGCYPGPVTDYAINTFLNTPPKNWSKHGFARGEFTSGEAGDWAATSKTRLVAVVDGLSNTLMIGGKALPPAVGKQNISVELQPIVHAPAQADAAEGDGDEGIFSPGNWSFKDGKKVLVSTGTGRGHDVVKEPPNENVKEYPKDGGVPWMYRDDEFKDKDFPPYQSAWGGPFEGGVHFCFGDGSVRLIKHTQKGTVNFARLLYPNDGNAVDVD